MTDAPTSSPPPPPSDRHATIAEGDALRDYILHERIGAGGGGVVHRASHRHIPERVVAIKIPHEEAAVELLRAEGAIAARLEEHPGVVRVLEIALEHRPPFLAIEYCPGGSLKELIARERAEEGGGPGVDAEGARELLRRLAAILARVHARSVVHGDLKPSNVLLDADGRPHLADFGLAKVRAGKDADAMLSLSLATKVEGEGEVAGTLAYMAPEQRRGEAIDARADVWAYGMILFEMLTGRLPEPGDALEDFVEKPDPVLERVFARCFTRYEKRFEDGSELLAALGGMIESGDAAAEPTEEEPDEAEAAKTSDAGLDLERMRRDARREISFWRDERPRQVGGWDGAWSTPGSTDLVLKTVDKLDPARLRALVRDAQECQKRHFPWDRVGFLVVANEIEEREECLRLAQDFFYDGDHRRGMLLFEVGKRDNLLRRLSLPEGNWLRFVGASLRRRLGRLRESPPPGSFDSSQDVFAGSEWAKARATTRTKESTEPADVGGELQLEEPPKAGEKPDETPATRAEPEPAAEPRPEEPDREPEPAEPPEPESEAQTEKDAEPEEESGPGSRSEPEPKPERPRRRPIDSKRPPEADEPSKPILE